MKMLGGAEKTGTSVTMDFFDSPYFSINKRLLRCMGLWPQQSRLSKILIRSLFGLLTIVFCTPHFITLFVYAGVDTNRLIQGIATVFYLIGTCLKMFMSIITEAKIQRMYENIAQNWKMVDDGEEKEILLNHSRIGRFLTIAYMSYMFSALIAFITMPMLPWIIDKIDPLNESRPLIFILDGVYLVDPYEHYKKIYVFESLACIMTVCIFSTADSSYAVCVQQCVGLMEVVKMRLGTTKNIMKQSQLSELQEKEATHKEIIGTIQLHQKAIDFANVLESTYAINFLVVICANAAILSIGSAVVRALALNFIIMNLNRPMEVLRYTMIYIGLMIHMLYLSWPGQKMIDASEGLLNDTYNNKWYEFSLKTQKMLKFMMMRCKEPCQLTAGGIYVLNVANCGAMLKTSLSYITVFASMV